MSTSKVIGMSETRGQQLQRRMEALGMNKTQLHQASGLSPKTISRALSDWPQTRPATFTNLERVIDEIEGSREPGEDEYVPGSEVATPFTIEMHGVFGVESVTFSGAPTDMEKIRQAAAEFVREARSGGTQDQP